MQSGQNSPGITSPGQLERQKGNVTLIGAGPGDPDLLTIAGMKALEQAEIVVYDRLVNPALLKHAARAEHVYMGKEVGDPHGAAQQRINDFIIEQALRGRRVVRLKGGDPYIFGRGGEEALAARALGIPVRVIPGVTAAIGAGASAGIPLTHRDIASSVAFVTGCAAGGHQQDGPDWRALASAVDTIVIYMMTRQLPQIARELIAGGRPQDEPVAIVYNATLPEEQIEIRVLGEFIENLEPAMSSPTIAIIGQVVRLRDGIRGLLQETASGLARIQ